MLIGGKFWLLLLLLGAVAVAAEDAEVIEADDGGNAEDAEGSGDIVAANETKCDDEAEECGEGSGVVDEMDEDAMDDEADDIIVWPPAGPIKGTVVGKLEGTGMEDDEMAACRSYTSDGNSFEGYVAFRGIPYAEPPLFERRFKVCSCSRHQTSK